MIKKIFKFALLMGLLPIIGCNERLVITEEFRENYDFQHYLDLMNSRGMFNTYEGRFPPEIEKARAHMQTTML